MTDAMRKAIDWIISEASSSGAGLSDMPTDAECAAMIFTALEFSQEDVTFLQDAAVRWRAMVVDSESTAPLDIETANLASAFLQSEADKYQSLASRISALLPPTEEPPK